MSKDTKFGSIKEFKTLQGAEYLSSDIPFITNRVISYWITKGIIDPINGKGKRRKLSFLELCWLKIVHELRKLEVCFDFILTIKRSLFEAVDINQAYLPEGKMRTELLKTLSQNGPISEDALKDRSDIMGELVKQFVEQERHITLLEMYLLEVIGLKTTLSLIVTTEGHLIPFVERYISDYMTNETFLSLYRSTHLSISVTDILKYFLMNSDFSFPYHELQISAQEARILEIIRSEQPESVTIKYKNGEPEMIELAGSRYIDIQSRLTDVIMSNGYEEITIKTGNGRILHCTKNKKIKLFKGTE